MRNNVHQTSKLFRIVGNRWINKSYICILIERGVRVVEGARLESVYTPKVYRGFESLPLCKTRKSAYFKELFLVYSNRGFEPTTVRRSTQLLRSEYN